jgi:hypothetical protein
MRPRATPALLACCASTPCARAELPQPLRQLRRTANRTSSLSVSFAAQSPGTPRINT